MVRGVRPSMEMVAKRSHVPSPKSSTASWLGPWNLILPASMFSQATFFCNGVKMVDVLVRPFEFVTVPLPVMLKASSMSILGVFTPATCTISLMPLCNQNCPLGAVILPSTTSLRQLFLVPGMLVFVQVMVPSFL